MTAESALLPCPFCGGEATATEHKNGYFTVGCIPCGVDRNCDEDDSGEFDAVAAWNTRALPEAHPLDNWKPEFVWTPDVPEGYVMVPREPTEEMIKSGVAHIHRWHQGYGASRSDTANAYKAMLAAAGKK